LSPLTKILRTFLRQTSSGRIAILADKAESTVASLVVPAVVLIRPDVDAALDAAQVVRLLAMPEREGNGHSRVPTASLDLPSR